MKSFKDVEPNSDENIIVKINEIVYHGIWEEGFNTGEKFYTPSELIDNNAAWKININAPNACDFVG